MKRFNNFRLLNVFTLELDKWEFELHRHNFYELIFVERGSGVHLLNGLQFPYKKGDVLLLTPDDAHEFEIKKRTAFTYLKFDEKILAQQSGVNNKPVYLQAFKDLLARMLIPDGAIPFTKSDRKHAFEILHIMQSEFSANGSYSQDMLVQLFWSLVMLIVRNVNAGVTTIRKNNNDVERLNAILSYIRIYSLDAEKMKISEMAGHFHMSPNYISIYVKKHTGLAIQQHVMQARIKTAEILLKQKKYSINEVAFRLGFNDASHFNKLFRKYKATSPGRFGQDQLKAS